MKKVHLIGNAHLDPVWLWQWQEGFAEIKATFRSALDRMREFDDFKFTAACGAYYMWIEKSDPAMFREIQERVKEGRWELAGGWMIQPDCNLPCGEAFARHALIVQRYFAEKFGKTAATGYNVDSFGHNGSLPMILFHSRMKQYVFMRPGAHEKALPDNLFLWESADGTRLPTYRIAHRYNIVEKTFDAFERIRTDPAPHDEMAFYGVGNHGGGPTVALLNRMHRELGDNYIYSTTAAYFESQKGKKLPVVQDDLQFHAKGCYSACSEIKKNNRYAEQKLLAAERFCVLSRQLRGTPYPVQELNRAWHNVLFNQFHDILGGCSVRPAYDDARLSHGEAMAIADRESNFAIQQIGWNINTVDGDMRGTSVSEEEAERLGLPFVVFNPHAFPVKECVRVVSRAFGAQNGTYAMDVDGKFVPMQQIRSARTNNKDKFDMLLQAEVPAFGYTVYRIHQKESLREMPKNPFTVGDNFVSNDVMRLTFDTANGELCSFYDEQNKRELLAAPTCIRLYHDEKNDTWAHGATAYDEEVPLTVTGSVRMKETGPLRTVVRTEQHFADSRVIREYALTAGERAVDVSVKVDYRETFGVLKFVFPVAAEHGECYADIPFGHIRRPVDGSEQVCNDWICIRDVHGGLGVANDCKYSFDAKGNCLALTVLRSAIFADHFGQNHRDADCEFMEQGESTFRYRIFPFAGFADAERQAATLQMPLTAYAETFHSGTLPLCASGLAVSADNIEVTAVKAHASGEGTVIRVRETDGRNTRAHLRFFDAAFDFEIGHDAVKTFHLQNGTVRETDFIE